MILGPLAEEQMRRSLSISQGDPRIFVTHGISALLLGLTVLILIAPLVIGHFSKKRKQSAGATGEE
jgi:putative tricarboxylic transport membrane protein